MVVINKMVLELETFKEKLERFNKESKLIIEKIGRVIKIIAHTFFFIGFSILVYIFIKLYFELS